MNSVLPGNCFGRLALWVGRSSFDKGNLAAMRCAVIIPARMGSTRFPGKPLVDLAGKSMVQWVVERALASGVADKVVVATPDEEISDACKSFGTETYMTSPDHPSGTDRVAEVAEKLDADVYVNVQGMNHLLGQKPSGPVRSPC